MTASPSLRDHARAELRDAGALFKRSFLWSLLPFAVLFATGMLVMVFAAEPRPRGGELAFTVLIVVLMAAAGATVPSAGVGLFAVLLRLAGSWILFSVVLSPTMGALAVWIGWSFIAERLQSLEFGNAGHGWVLAPVLLLALAVALLIALLLFVAGALVGFVFSLPPLVFGIMRRLRARARLRSQE